MDLLIGIQSLVDIRERLIQDRVGHREARIMQCLSLVTAFLAQKDLPHAIWPRGVRLCDIRVCATQIHRKDGNRVPALVRTTQKGKAMGTGRVVEQTSLQHLPL